MDEAATNPTWEADRGGAQASRLTALRVAVQ